MNQGDKLLLKPLHQQTMMLHVARLNLKLLGMLKNEGKIEVEWKW